MEKHGELTLFLCGDVMTGRGVDQILPQSCPPHLYEPYVTSALTYVELAERVNGPIPRPVGHDYVWGEALPLLDRIDPAARIINLETSITTSEDAAPKTINYRMHPGNVGVLTAARIDCCVLANNHVLDWGEDGLVETLEVLERAGIAVAGAGRDRSAAAAPAVLATGAGARVLVFGLGATTSGIPLSWRAGDARPGVNLLPDLSRATAASVARRVMEAKRPGDLAVVSIHWGGNWGFRVPKEHRRFARALMDHGGVDVVHGHSSHHPIAVETHRNRPIMYGCGDFIDDYEGIEGYDEFRGDLTLMWIPTFRVPSGDLARFEMVPLRIRRFRLERPSISEHAWVGEMLERECHRLGQRVCVDGDVLRLG